jgi:hypothetical protein
VNAGVDKLRHHHQCFMELSRYVVIAELTKKLTGLDHDEIP